MSKAPYPRMNRVNAILHEVLADEVERMKDPRLEFVTITAVETAPDLRRATVFYSTIETSHLEDAGRALTHAAARLRHVIGDQVRMKYTPALEFRADPAIVGGERIDAILRELREGTTGE